MPLTSVTAVSVPCSAGDSTVMVAPGIDRPSLDVMVPVMTPVCRPWAPALEARPATRAIAHARLASTLFIAMFRPKRSTAPDTDAGERTAGRLDRPLRESAVGASVAWGMWRAP